MGMVNRVGGAATVAGAGIAAAVEPPAVPPAGVTAASIPRPAAGIGGDMPEGGAAGSDAAAALAG